MKHTRVRHLLFSSLPALLLGCTSMNVITLTDRPLPQVRHWTHVDVYQDIREVSGPYQEIAVLEITSAVSEEKMVRDSQHRAGELGGNGIVLEHVGTHTEMNQMCIGEVFVPIIDQRWDGRILVILVKQ